MKEVKQEEIENVVEKRKSLKIRIIAVSVGVGIAILSFFAGFFTRYATLDKEMQALIDVKNGIQNSYYKEITDEEFYDAIFDAVNNTLLDRYSQYMTKEEFKETLAHAKGEYEGLGLSFYSADNAEESLKIIRVSGNSPAENVGIRAGDYVVGIGRTKEDVVSVTDYEHFKSVLDGYKKDESFYLYTCATYTGQDVNEYVIAKSNYTENYVYYRTNTSAYRFTGTKDAQASVYDNAFGALPANTAYIQLTQFNGNANQAFDSAMELFKQEGKTHLVLDLRGNGGGYMYIMQDIAKYFCKNTQEKKPVAAYAQYSKSRSKYVATGNVYDEYFGADSQIYVLADSNTASASECLLGVMLDYGAIDYGHICLSERNGEYKTFGKGIMQVTSPLSIFRGDALKLTTARVLWPNGNCIHDRGILSTDGTKTVEEDYRKDAELENALQQFGLK